MAFDTDDIAHLSALMHLHERCMGYPKLKAIADEAMKDLEQYAASLDPNAVDQNQLKDQYVDPGAEHTKDDYGPSDVGGVGTTEPAHVSRRA